MKNYSKEDYRHMLWKNGGGTTTELFRYPLTGEFLFRLSCAELKENGPFSHYEGYDRHLMITSGEGCVLENKDQKVILKKGDQPFFFAGEDSLFCELIQGPVKDFNVMIKRDWGVAKVQLLRHAKGEIELQCTKDLLFAYNADDESLLELENKDRVTLYSDFLIIVELKKKAG